MAQRIVFFCDVHEIKGEDAIADESLPIIGFSGKFYKFFWCPECFTTNTYTVAELMAMIEEHGVELSADDLAQTKRKPGPKGPAAVDKPLDGRDNECLWCVYSGTAGALNYHIRKHGFRGFADAYGKVCPVCDSEQATLGNHAKTHGAGSVASLFTLAEQAGDPYGIVAARRKAGVS